MLDPKVESELQKYGFEYEVFVCDPKLADTAAFCEHYGFGLQESANTIVVASRKVEPTLFAACVVLATTRLDVNKKVCQLLGVKKASFADGETTKKITGMAIGGVTAVGIEEMSIYVDSLVMAQPRIILGGGNRSSKLLLSSAELLKLPGVRVVEHLAKPA